MARQYFYNSTPEDNTLVAERPSQLTHVGDNRPYLSVVHPRGKANRYAITEKGLLVGRGRHADVSLQDGQVSRKHCHIRLTDGGIVAEDLGSTNGTHVNGEAIKQCVLDPSRRVKIGEYVLRVEYRARVEIKAEQQLEEAALKDDLTGLNNRRWFFSQSAAFLARTVNSPQSLTVVMIDIDHFKGVNDRFGHAAGDHVLRHVAAILLKYKRSTDLLARFGGEEFVMLLPNTDSTDALVFCDHLCETVSQLPTEFEGHSIQVQVSVGTWTSPINRIGTIERAIGGADAAMYRAKRAGRNRVSD